MKFTRFVPAIVVGALISTQLGGCPQVSNPTETITGSTGDSTSLGSIASVTVLTPANNLSVSGGVPVDVNWQVTATTPFGRVDIIVDRDTTPENGNEITVFKNLTIDQTSRLVDTTALTAGTYFIGVILREEGKTVAFDYAAGALTIDQRPDLFFSSPRDNFAYDRAQAVTPSFDVAWSVRDPDSIITVRILLDPDDTPNGNEILLRTSNSQTGDSFTFDLPTASFEAGTYRILASVSDGANSFSFYAPTTIRLRARLAGEIDLRDVGVPQASVNGAVFEGFNPRDNAGSFVSSIKDIDGDGFSDFIVLSQFGKPFYDVASSRTGVGEAYLIYGRQSRFSGRLNLNSTGTLFRGDIFGGVPQVGDPIRPSRGITSFALLSDWDSDGVREMAFGVPFCDSLSLSAFNFNVNAPLDKDGYFRSGVVVVAAGSVLRPDLGFPGRSVLNLAEIGTLAHEPIACAGYVRFDLGRPTGSPTDICPCAEGFIGPKAPDSPVSFSSYNRHLANVGEALPLGGARLGCRLSSNETFDQFGESVSAGDFDSILIAASNRDPSVGLIEPRGSVAGAGLISQFFCGVKEGFYPWSNIGAPVANPAVGYLGSVQTIGFNLIPHGGPYHYIVDDLRNVDQIGVGFASGNSPGYTVDPDDSDPCSAIIDPNLAFPDNSIRYWSSAPGARLSNVKGIDDVNGDGLLDILIGAPLTNQGAGACYLILGRLRDLVRQGELQLEELGLPSDSSDRGGRRIFDGVRIVGSIGDQLGQAQDRAGDFNNDGLPDVVIGSPLVNGRRGGAAVFFGSRDVINLTSDELPFSEIASRNLGVIFVGDVEGDLAGARVSGCGDIDGDGNDDILIAAPNKSIRLDTNGDGVIDIDRTDCGVVYLIYGSPKLRGTISLGLIGTESLPGAMFIGANSGDSLGAGIGDQGDRTTGLAGAGDVDGDGRNDLILSSGSASPRDRVSAGETYLLYGAGD